MKRTIPLFFSGDSQNPFEMEEIKLFMEKPLLFCAIVGIISVDRVQVSLCFAGSGANRPGGRRAVKGHLIPVAGNGTRAQAAEEGRYGFLTFGQEGQVPAGW